MSVTASALRGRRLRLAFVSLFGASVLVAALPPIMSLARPSGEDPGCTLQTIAGDYGFRTTGDQMRPDGTRVDFASIGRYVRDGQGNVVSGAVTSNVGGIISHVTLTGTYTVNPDCTGSQTSNLNTRGTVHLEFVIVDDGQRVEFVITDPTGTVGGTQIRQTTSNGA